MRDLRAAARSLLSTPVPTAVVVVTLALAIGANTAIFSVVNGLLLRPLPYRDDGQLVVLWSSPESRSGDAFPLSPADYIDVRESVEAFDGKVAIYRSIGSTLTGLDRPVRVGSLAVTPGLFEVLDPALALGRFFEESDGRPGFGDKVVLTHAAWTRHFGADPDILGKGLEMDGEPYTVIGVAAPGFQFPPGSDEMEVYFPMGIDYSVLPDRAHRMFDAVARLDDGVPLQSAREELSALASQLAQEFPNTNDGWSLTARPLREEVLGDLGSTVSVLAGAVFLVLLAACANIANVLVARSSATAREFAVRAALGASPRELARRSLTESLLLGVVGGLAGVFVASLGISGLRAVLPAEIARAGSVSLDANVLLFAAALSIGVAVLFGLLPALRSMGTDVHELLKPAGAGSAAAAGGRRVREALVVVEVALAIVLLIAAGLMVRSFARLNDMDPGFRSDGVVSVAVQLPRSRYDRDEWRLFFERFVQRVEALPGIVSAGAVSDLPMSPVGLDFEMDFTLSGLDARAPTARPNADFRLTLPGYFDSMGMRIVSGRDFDALDSSADRAIAVVNETVVARYFEDLDPIGRVLTVPMMGEVEIAGVVSDVRHEGLQAEHQSEIFIPYGQISTAEMHIVVRSDLDTGAVASAVSNLLAEMDPQLAPTQVASLSDLLWESVARPRFNTAMLSGLALCAALLAAIGTYGIVAYSVAQRTGEIGVRMALGADAAATVSMIVRRALLIVAAGAGLGMVGALGASRLLARLLFEVPATDPLTYALVLLAAVLVGFLAAWLPARRATRIDPVSALRND